MNFLRYILLFVVLNTSLFGIAQNQAKPSFGSFMDKLQWGGNLGMSFSAYTYIQIAPVVYYEVVDNLVLGVGLDFTYYNDKRNPNYHTEGSIWSPRIFARYFILDNIFVHAEYQQYYYKDKYSQVPNDWIWSEPSYYAGAGYRQWIGQNSYMFAMLLFDLQGSDINFGINPRVQMGFAAGF